ncbi:hypothetical protein BGX28_001711 [Mortierella sp. GBA30]|nr:hypothetical protein BGX28_001711 [Mortierella sp. GBA30]
MSIASFCAKEGRMMKRLSLAPFWSLAQTRGFDKLYEAPFLARVRHLYIQQELSGKVEFASTLTSLHIDAGFNEDREFECDCSPVPVWNAVLRRLLNLEILRIDRFITDYSLFEGLGRSPPSLPPSTSLGLESSSESGEEGDEHQTIVNKEIEKDIKEVTYDVGVDEGIEISCAAEHRDNNSTNAHIVLSDNISKRVIEDWSEERPFLQELQITFRDACQVQTKDLDRELIQRFRFLERLCFACHKRPEDLDESHNNSNINNDKNSGRKVIWRPGLVVEHRRFLNK